MPNGFWRDLVIDGLFVAGVAAAAVGVYTIYEPAAWVLVGTVTAVTAALMARGGRR